jgi:hypothetical protein
MLFTALSLALWEYSFSQIANRESPQGPASLQTERAVVGAVGIGLLAAILTLTRPEGLGLAGLVIAALLLLPRLPTRDELGPRLLVAGIALLSCGALLTPYIAFNLNTSGSLFPNTLYAKQAEYQLRLAVPGRMWQVLGPTLAGAQALLLPGFCYAAYRLISRRQWLALSPMMWWAAFLAVYAVRLPVSYQHGRYTMPTIPLLVLYGLWGTAGLLRLNSPRLLWRTSSRAALLAMIVLAFVFWGRGAVAYRDDVGFVEGEMVATARWLNEHAGPDDIVAVHDIGAVGYLTELHLLDMAGLINPEVIPFIGDAPQLAAWMQQQNATYAVFFRDFSPAYAQLDADPALQPVYCTDYAWTRKMNHENMCVYRLLPEKQP